MTSVDRTQGMVPTNAISGSDAPRWWEDEIALRSQSAARMGGDERVKRHHAAGRLTARERVALLLDEGTFREIGRFTGKGNYEDGLVVDVEPANVIAGTGKVDGRKIVVVAEDFTLRGGSSESTSPDKWQYAERLALEYKIPLVRLVETAGGSVNILGQNHGTKIPGYPHWPWMDLLGQVPVVGAALGPCAGLGALRVVSTHFSLMAKGTSQVFAGGPAVVAPGVGEFVDKEELGGSKVHAHGSGVVDNEGETETDVLSQIRAFLAYLPANVGLTPPVRDCNDPPDRRSEMLADVIPADKRKAYQSRTMLNAIFDDGSLFEVGRYSGRSIITMLGRLNGHPVGVLANDPMFLGGALTAEGGEKQIRFVDLCDTFNLPIVNLVDQPGTYVGSAAERKGTIRRGVRAALAIEQATIPWCTVFVRRAFGLAGSAYAPLTHGINWRYAWPSAYWGSIPIEGGVEAAYKVEINAASDPDGRRRELIAKFKWLENPFLTAEKFGIQDIIDPRDTRPLLCEWVEMAYALLPDIVGPTRRYMRC